MDAIKHALTYIIWGAPVWAYLVLAGAAGLNELVHRSKWTTAESLLQQIWRIVFAIPGLNLLTKVPGLDKVIAWLTYQPIEALRLPNVPPVPPAAALLPILFIGTLLALPACPPGCASEAKTVATGVGLKCTAPEVLKLIGKYAAKLMFTLMSGGDLTAWETGTLAGLQQDGITDGPGFLACLYDQVETGLVPPAGSKMSPEAVRAHERLGVLKARLKSMRSGGTDGGVK